VTVQQLRIYEIFDHNAAAFHARFRDQCMPIMARYGFRILETWEASGDGGRAFVYLLEWPDEPTMRDAWERFLADEEWREIKRRTAAEHGNLVGEIEDRVLRVTEYSPATLSR
jgi:hypothetical protein